MSRIAVLNSIVIEVTRVGLGTGGSVAAHIDIGHGDGGVGRGDHGDAVVGDVHVVARSSAA